LRCPALLRVRRHNADHSEVPERFLERAQPLRAVPIVICQKNIWHSQRAGDRLVGIREQSPLLSPPEVVPLSLSGQRQRNGEQGGASVVRRGLQVTKEIARVRAS